MAGLEHAGNRLPALGIRQEHSLGRQREQGVLGLVRLVRDEDTDSLTYRLWPDLALHGDHHEQGLIIPHGHRSGSSRR